MQRIENLGNQLQQEDLFNHLTLAPPDPILGTALAYRADKDAKKINLGIGAYRDEEEQPYVFNCIRKVTNILAKETQDGKLKKEYLGVDGLLEFNKLSQELIFGENHPFVKENKIATVQVLSGTGSLRIGFDFLKRFTPNLVLVSNPTWSNHLNIITDAGLKFAEYPYYKEQTRGLDFEGMKSALLKAAPGTIVLLHACAHNPTGVDPTNQQWEEIAKIFKEKKLFPFFDSAYQGYASGDLKKDAESIHIFLNHGLQMLVSQSYAKNFGLYGERIGTLSFVCKSKDVQERVLSQVKLIIRAQYSSPPMHGALLIQRVLQDKQLRKEWEDELKMVSNRIIEMRKVLKEQLIKNGTKGNWDHITNQIGMFSYTGLTKKQCEILIDKWHIYLLKNGRISMAGITKKNVNYLANAIKDAVENS